MLYLPLRPPATGNHSSASGFSSNSVLHEVRFSSVLSVVDLQQDVCEDPEGNELYADYEEDQRDQEQGAFRESSPQEQPGKSQVQGEDKSDS